MKLYNETNKERIFHATKKKTSIPFFWTTNYTSIPFGAIIKQNVEPINPWYKDDYNPKNNDNKGGWRKK